MLSRRLPSPHYNAWMNVATRFALFTLALFFVACAPAAERAATRAVIAGNIVLIDIDGLNDMSRVRVDIGRGEGGVVPTEDGSFFFDDLEPDEYNLTVTYVGGLTPAASKSAYVGYEKTVLALQGGNVNVGDVVLSLATGTVQGEVQAGEEAIVEGAEVSLLDGTGLVRSVQVRAGAYLIEEVPVGYHQVQVRKEGYATAAGQSACRPPVQVEEGGQVVTVPPIVLAKTTPSFSPGAGEVSQIVGNVWYLTSASLTLRIQAAYATKARIWLGSQTMPDWAAMQADGFSISGIEGGRTALYIQLRNACGFESDVFELQLVRDSTPPAITELRFTNLVEDRLGRRWVARPSASLDVWVQASDEHSTVTGIALYHDAENGTGDPAELTFTTIQSESAAVSRLLQVLLSEGEGEKHVYAYAKDIAGNVSAPFRQTLWVDYSPPSIQNFLIAGGAARTNQVAPVVQLEVLDEMSGVSGMLTSLTGNFDGITPGPFLQSFPVSLVPPEEDGNRLVHVRILDAAGNSVTQSASIQLDREAPTASLQPLDGRSAFSAPTDVTIQIFHPFDTAWVGLGLEDMRCGGGPLEAPDAFTESTRTVSLEGADGVYRVRACIIDKAGNESELSLLLTLDTSPPDGTLQVANGAAFATSNEVDIRLTASEPVTMRLGAETGNTAVTSSICTSEAGAIPFQTRTTVTLSSEGPHVVWACLYDDAGHRTLLQEEIVLDTTPPVLSAVVVGDGNTDGVDGATRVLASASTIEIEGEGASLMKVSVTSLQDVAWQPFGRSLPYNFLPPDGPRILRVQLKDDAGLESAVSELALELVTTGTIQGVVRAEAGEDLSTLEAVVLGTRHAASVASDGSFEITGVSGGTHILRIRSTDVSNDAVAPSDFSALVVPGEIFDLGTVTLRRARGGLGGSVVSEDGEALGGVIVELVGAAYQTMTNSAGLYELTEVGTGTYQVRFVLAGYATHIIDNILVERDAITSVSEQQLYLVRGTLVGMAKREDADALDLDHGNIEVTAFGNGNNVSVFSDETGAFRIEGLKPGFYNVEAKADGYLTQRENGLYVTGGIDNDGGQFLLERRKGRVAGVVMTSSGKYPNGAIVQVLGTNYSTTADGQGRYEMYVPVGNYSGVKITKPYYRDASYTETVTVTESGTFTVPLLQLAGMSGRVSGSVTLADVVADGHEGIRVRLEGRPGGASFGAAVETLTTANGNFSFGESPAGFSFDSLPPDYVEGAFPGVPVGVWRLTATPPEAELSAGREVAVVDLQVLDDEETRVSLQLRDLYVLINDGSPSTNDPNVTLTFGATGCATVQVGVGGTPESSATHHPCNTKLQNFALGDAQGEREVFAVYYDANGIVLGETSDSIWLDSAANIENVSHGIAYGTKLAFGARVTLVARTGEAGGDASFTIQDYEPTPIELVENGPGCSAGEVGCYGTTYDILERIDIQPNAAEQTTGPGTLRVSFVDSYGNTASALGVPLTVGIAPIIRDFEIEPDLQSQNATVRFTTDESATGQVFIGKTENDLCAVGAGCPATTSGLSHTQVVNGSHAGESAAELERNQPYYVQVRATDAKGNASYSAVREFFLRPDPPRIVIGIPGDSRVHVRWEAPPQSDIAGYRVERSEDQGETWENLSGIKPYNHEALLFVDASVVNNEVYKYRVISIDEYGNESIPGTTEDMKNGNSEAIASFSQCALVSPRDFSGSVETLVGGVLPFCSVWSEHGSPYLVQNSISVPSGGVLIVGPNVEIRFEPNSRAVIEGRIAVYGDRGSNFTVENDFKYGEWWSSNFRDYQWDFTGLSNGFQRETQEGVSKLIGSNGRWRGIYIRNLSSMGQGEIAVNGYRSGDLLYRFEMGSCSYWNSSSNTGNRNCIDSDSSTSLMRGSVFGDVNSQEAVNGKAFHAGSSVFFGGIQFEKSVIASRTSGGWDNVIFASDSKFNSSYVEQRNSGTGVYFFDGSFGPAIPSGTFYHTFYLSDSFFVPCNTYNWKSSVFSLSSEIFMPTMKRTNRCASAGFADMIQSHNSFLVVDKSSIGVSYSSFLMSKIPEFTSKKTVSSSVIGSYIVTSDAREIEHSSFVSFNCEINARLKSGLSFGNSLNASTTSIDCGVFDGENNQMIVDYLDDIELGKIENYKLFDSSPSPVVSGPRFISKDTSINGLISVSGRDLEDGPLSGGFFTHEGQTVQDMEAAVRDGSVTLDANVLDSDGNMASVPWSISVIHGSGLPRGFHWPNRKRWRSAAAKFDDLPPRDAPTDSATFRWRCFEADCVPTCTLDNYPEVLCRSPLDIAGLGPGEHTVIFQPRNTAGEPIDLPQHYTWTVGDDIGAVPSIRLRPLSMDSGEVDLFVADTDEYVVTCSIDGRHEIPCRDKVTYGGIYGNGDIAHELVIRVRSRTNGLELEPARTVQLNVSDDQDGDGWPDDVDPCPYGAEIGQYCNDHDRDGVPTPDDACPFGDAEHNISAIGPLTNDADGDGCEDE